MKKITLLFLIIPVLGLSQQNLGVDQSNPQAKVHITQTGTQPALKVEDQSTDATPFIIDANGKIGVGTETPGAKVDIEGSLRTDSLNMGTGASSGYVMTSDASGNASWQPVLPAGVIMPYMGSIAPDGWLLCDGSQISRTAYSNLFAVIGSSNGNGDGASTFHLPDLRGRFLRGMDNGTGRDPNAATRTAQNPGGNTGDNVGTYQDDAMETHIHRWYDSQGSAADDSYSSTGVSTNISNSSISDVGITAGTGSQLNQDYYTSTPANKSGENRPINVTVNYIIKY